MIDLAGFLSNNAWTNYEFFVTDTSPSGSILRFASNNGIEYGPFLDNESVTAVPESSSFIVGVMLGPGRKMY